MPASVHGGDTIRAIRRPAVHAGQHTQTAHPDSRPGEEVTTTTRTAILALAPLGFAGAAHAGFVGSTVESSITAGVATHRVYAQFNGAGDTVLRAQFVLNTGHAARTISPRLSHNTGFGTAVTESEGTFALVPTPGAIALLALAGVAARWRRETVFFLSSTAPQ